MDYKNGKYGINTSANRGADTFIPFNSGLSVATFNWHGKYDNARHYVNLNFQTPVSVRVTCLSSGIGSIDTSLGSLNEGASLTGSNITTLSIGDGNYPEGYSEGNASVKVEML